MNAAIARHAALSVLTLTLLSACAYEAAPVAASSRPQATVAPAVCDAITARHPGDGATGFAISDLRGALWVEVPQVHP
ncbi:hypothetical protein [Pseudoxanthomonas koreensis]|uniref:hypothetical protein n=1 Tax=Pseudoxanthomonas koreensis TaxID=266061 RepID=UPI0035A6DE78